MIVVAIDPGKHASGIAKFIDGVLKSVAYADDAETYADEVVVEIPQVYPKSEGDPNDLIEVAFAAGRLVNQVVGPAELIKVKPAQWKGQVPKKIHHARAKAALSEWERTIVDRHSTTVESKKHNIWDAVALGLWHLGRLK